MKNVRIGPELERWARGLFYVCVGCVRFNFHQRLEHAESILVVADKELVHCMLELCTFDVRDYFKSYYSSVLLVFVIHGFDTEVLRLRAWDKVVIGDG